MMDRQSEVDAIEAYFLPLDIGMDLCILVILQAALDRICFPRLLRAQAALCGFTLLFFALPQWKFLLQWMVFPAAAAFLLDSLRIRRILEGSAALFCGYAAAAGFCTLAGRRWTAVLAGLAAFGLLMHRRHIRSRWNIEITIKKNGNTCRIPALIDTGNRLREHKSRLPVLIAEEDALFPIEIDPAECRTLPYGVLGSSGEIACFRADRIMISGRSAPECWVAVFPGRIPGRIRALAPPEFADCTREKPEFIMAVRNRLRRFYHGVFKRKAVHLRFCGSVSKGFRVLHRRK